jgi:hypothetical protein
MARMAIVIPRDLLRPAHNRRLPIASPISFQTTRRHSLTPSWTGASFTLDVGLPSAPGLAGLLLRPADFVQHPFAQQVGIAFT